MTRASNAKLNRKRLGRNAQAHAHKMVAETAKGMAQEVWDRIMTERGDIFDRFRAAHPECATTQQLADLFTGRLWPTMLGEARATLALMLRNPHIDDLQKAAIYDALLLDHTLIVGRGAQGAGSNFGGLKS